MMWFFCLKFVMVLHYVHSVRITNVRVPEVLQYGTRKAITLDCDYIINNVTGLVIKWFFNDRNNTVYQWIPPHKPQALGILHDKLDLTYKVSNNPYTYYRALRILDPEPELTGNYTCVVSTYLSEAERTRPMTIFVPETKFDLVQDRLHDGFLNIICVVEGVYPKPELEILVGNRPQKAKSTLKLINGRYTALTRTILSVDTLPPTVELMCDLQVPLANYWSQKRDMFYLDPPPTSPRPSRSNAYASREKGQIFGTKSAMISIIILYYITDNFNKFNFNL